MLGSFHETEIRCSLFYNSLAVCVWRWRGRRRPYLYTDASYIRPSAGTNADANSDSNPYPDANTYANTHSDPYAHADANPYPDANSDTHADASPATSKHFS